MIDIDIGGVSSDGNAYIFWSSFEWELIIYGIALSQHY